MVCRFAFWLYLFDLTISSQPEAGVAFAQTCLQEGVITGIAGPRMYIMRFIPLRIQLHFFLSAQISFRYKQSL